MRPIESPFPGLRALCPPLAVALVLSSCGQVPVGTSARQATIKPARSSGEAAPPGTPRRTGGPQPAEPAPLPSGRLDQSFASTGFFVHDNAAGGSGNDNGEAVAIDAAGRPVVAGFSTNANGVLVMTLWRFTPNGALDTSFNGVGFVTHAGGGGGGTNTSDQAVGTSVAIDAVGRILVGGYSIADNVWGATVWRFAANGTPDAGFGTDGMVRFVSPQSGGVNAEFDAAGRIRLAGFSWNGSNWDSSIWRYDANGVAEASNAFVSANYSTGGNNEDIGVDIAHDFEGRTLMTGYGTNAEGNQEMLLWRFNADGTPDAAFNGNGLVRHDNAAGGGGNDVGRSIAFSGIGRIVVVGWSPRSTGDVNADLAIWRFRPDGTPDTTFNSTGYVTHNGAAGGDGNDWGRAVAIDARGRIVVAGQSQNASDNADMAVWRYNGTGAPDAGFGNVGHFVHGGAAGGAGGNDGGRGIAIDALGRLVVVGRSTNANGNLDMTIWRVTP
jgi:uncharacterized delta-60 repeat protein